MDKRTFKNTVYHEISRVSKALANPVRLEIIDFIANGEKCVEEIALQLQISIANASQHLQTLKKERLVITRKEGHFIYYSLQSPEVYKAWDSLRNLTVSTSPFVNQSITEFRDTFQYDKPVSLKEITKRKDIHLLDVRPRAEYNKGKLKNAVSIPLEELADRLSELPKNKLLIAYCRGMFCTLADEAVKLLKEKGFNAKKIEESVLDTMIK